MVQYRAETLAALRRYNRRVRIIFAGTPETAVPSLSRLIAAEHDVVAVLTRAPAPVGRKRTLRPSAVHEAATALGIPVLTPRSLRDADIGSTIRQLAPEAVAVVAYGLLVPADLLSVPRKGWINLHFSLLPEWRGAAPVQYAVAAGQETTGASTFLLEEGLDTGPVFKTLTETIRPDDTSGTLLDRLAESGANLLVETFAALEDGSAIATPQHGEPSYAPTLGSADARVDWKQSAQQVENMIRGYTPAPGPWTMLGDLRIKLGPVIPVPGTTDLGPGQLRDDLVGTGSHAVRLGTVAPAGKRAMAATDWLRGAHLSPSAGFEVIA